MASAEATVIDAAAHYDKRCKAAHRYEIVDVRGRLQLTVPLAKPAPAPGARPTWADCAVSTHDEWWRRHRTALESAYGRTPYFEFLIDKFDGVFRSPEEWPKWPSALDLIREANRAVRSILLIDSPMVYATEPQTVHTDPGPALAPYWQVRQHLHGFQPGLSVLDLLFNLGPEAALLMRD